MSNKTATGQSETKGDNKAFCVKSDQTIKFSVKEERDANRTSTNQDIANFFTTLVRGYTTPYRRYPTVTDDQSNRSCFHVVEAHPLQVIQQHHLEATFHAIELANNLQDLAALNPSGTGLHSNRVLLDFCLTISLMHQVQSCILSTFNTALGFIEKPGDSASPSVWPTQQLRENLLRGLMKCLVDFVFALRDPFHQAQKSEIIKACRTLLSALSDLPERSVK